jgi:hypothetical protein
MLTFAGEPLLFPANLAPDPPPDAPKLPWKTWNRIDEWLAYHHDPADISQFGGSDPRIASARHACRSRFEQNKGLGLPVVNWPRPPLPRLNTLYWPTGATRWAHGYFLATKATKERIVNKLKSDSNTIAGSLGFGDDLDGSTDTPTQFIDMYLLPPRPMSSVGGNDDLWLLPLVDVRYFWQYLSFGDNAVTTSTTWASLFSTLSTQLGVTVTVDSSVEAAYLKPDPIDFSRRFDNAALLLDAAAWSVGRRIVRNIDGTVVCQSRSAATAKLNQNRGRKWQLIAGGTITDRCDLPAALIITYRKIKQYLLQSDNKLYTVEKTAPSGALTLSGKKLVIHCAAYADYNTSDVLQNTSALGDLATQIKDDYYGWAGTNYDGTFAGIPIWHPCGYDDAIIWRFGSLCGGNLQAQTRVQSLPGHVWPELNLCSDSTKEIVEPSLMAVANADIAAGDEGLVSLYDSFSHDTNKDVTMRNIGGTTWKSGKRGKVDGIGDAVWLGFATDRGTTSKEVILDIRIKSGDTQIEAQTATADLENVSTPAWEDKIPLTSC